MGAEVSAAEDAESHLLQVATNWDVVGLRPEEFPEVGRRRVLDRYPRLDFGKEFLALFEDQAGRKPATAAAQAVESGGGVLIAANPLDTYSSQP